jgi:hypothetical protein
MTRTYASEEVVSAAHDWVDLLRANCLALAAMSAEVQSISISHSVPETEEERTGVTVLAKEIASEYCLRCDFEIRESFLTLRFTRPLPAPHPGRKASALRRAFLLFGPHDEPSMSPNTTFGHRREVTS